MGRRRYGVGLALLTLVVAGCSGGDDRPEPGPVEAWRVPSITPIGQPVRAGDVVVVYGRVDRDLYLYGVAVADGTVRWRQVASPSMVTSGIPLTPMVLKGRVAYFRPDPRANLAARLVIAAPETGDDLLVSEPMHFTSQPATCADGKDVCVMALDTGGSDVSRRFSVEAGGPVPDQGAGPPPDSRFIGVNLIELGQRQPELFAGFEGGTVRWRSALTNHFPSGYSTDEGWNFELYKPAGLYVGSVGRPPDRTDASSVVRDLSKAHTAAIDTKTGSSAWRSDGAKFACDAKIDVNRPVGEGRWEVWPVRCRYRGTLHYDKGTAVTTYQGLDVTVEGFDVSSGNTTWSVPLGPAEAFMHEDKRATKVSESEVLVQSATGPLIIELSNGSTRTPDRGEAFWCETNVIFDHREPRYLRSGEAVYGRRGGTLLDPCAADGSPTTVVPRQLATSLGATAGDRTVVATGRGIAAYDRRR